MAITKSGLFVVTWIDILDATQLAIDLSLTTHKLALFTNSITPNFSTDTAYGAAPYNANEVSGTGYTAGGAAITGTSVTEDPTETLKWTSSAVTWTTSTISNARGGLIYADALAGNNAILLLNFGADFSSTAGDFTVTPASGGWFNIDLA